MYPLKKGKIAPQAHVGIPEGTFEEEHGRKGFYGKSAHLYHAHPPTGWIRFEGKLRPHLLRPEPARAVGLRTTRKACRWRSSATTTSASTFRGARSPCRSITAMPTATS